MATLTEIAEWIAGIYQIEQPDPVLGGAPNETTGAGLTNIPTQQLAKRTAYLKSVIEAAGIGMEAKTLETSIDAITRGGLYACAGTATGSPDGAAVNVIHLPSNGTAAATQIAIRLGTINRIWMRRKQADSWAAWVEIMTGSNVQSSATDATAGRLLTVGAFGLGAVASPIITNLNDNTLPGGTYRTTLADTISGTFPTGVSGNGRTGVLQVNRLDAGSVLQTWRPIFSDQVWERRYTLETWQPWRRSWDGVPADALLTANGYQRLPSGLIMQWGVGGTTSGSAAVTFPIAFPSSTLSLVVSDWANDALPGFSHIVSSSAETRFGFTAVSTLHDGTLASTSFRYIAMGF